MSLLVLVKREDTGSGISGPQAQGTLGLIVLRGRILSSSWLLPQDLQKCTITSKYLVIEGEAKLQILPVWLRGSNQLLWFS